MTLLVLFAGTSATCWAASPEHTNLPSRAQAPGQAGSAALALHCRCAHRGACGAQPPPSGQAEPKSWQARQEDPSLPHLHGFALFYSFFPILLLFSYSLPPSSLLQGSRKFHRSLEEHQHLLLLTEEPTDPPRSRFLTDTGSPPGCPYFLTRIPPPRSEVVLQPHSFKE